MDVDGMYMEVPNKDAILGSIIPLFFLSIVAIILRFYSRSKRQQPFLVDDWLMIPALILLTGCAIIMFYGIGTKSLAYPAPTQELALQMLASGGMGKRSLPTDMSPSIVRSRRLEYAFLCIFTPANGLVKTSVLLLYRRIFVVQKNNWKDPRNAFFLAAVAVVLAWATGNTLVTVFFCRGHFEWWFDLILSSEKCIDGLKFAYQFAISDFITDVLIILIPIPFVWKLRLPLDKKLAVLLVFLLGAMSAIASLIRMLWMIWATNTGYNPATDEEQLLTSELYWCLVEITVAIIAACLPTLRGLVKTNSVDSVFKSVRSIFSIRSQSSSQSDLALTKESKEKSHGHSRGSSGKSSPNMSVGEYNPRMDYSRTQTTASEERRVAPWV